MRVFLDTSGLFCLYDVRDSHHVLASELFALAERRVTTSYVLVELGSLMIARRAHLEMALRFVNRLQTDPSFEVIWITEEMHSAGMGRLGRRLDKTYSLCDAVSFVDMDSQDMNAALTTDHHFEQEGFTRLLK